jgi:predicted dehydrogenase
LQKKQLPAEYIFCAKKQKVLLSFGFNRRFAPIYLKLKEIIGDNKIEIAIYEKTRGYSIDEVDNKYLSGFSKKFGPPIFEFIGHLVDLARWISGPVDKAYFSHSKGEPDFICNTLSTAIFSHKNNAKSSMFFNTYGTESHERIVVYSNNTMAEINGNLFTKCSLKLIKDDKEEIIYKTGKDIVLETGFVLQAENFINKIKNKAYNGQSFEDMAETLQLCIDFDGSDKDFFK